MSLGGVASPEGGLSVHALSRLFGGSTALKVLCIGAHCDDIAIGAGGSLLELCRAHPGLSVTALVLTGGGSLRWSCWPTRTGATGCASG